ncbi:MAG: PepSY-like domain-containing protein [Prevotellaceae bacterium]|jgi:hypothetical protein|nr:PepSY-like domain-containing protein [Prevotellaceae bacterium]
MKKLLTMLVVTLLCTATPCAAQDINQLPAVARNFINQYFPQIKVSYVIMDRDLFDKEYEVLLADRTEIKFDSDGQWKEVDCKRAAVPDGIVPDYILKYVRDTFPEEFITQIERGRKGTEVELRNDVSFLFNRRGRLIEVDD